MTPQDTMRLALEALEQHCPAYRGREHKRQAAIEALKAALAQQGEQGEQPPLSTTEVLRVTPEGEFIWAENADEAIEHGDFTASPAMRHILKALRDKQVEQQPVARLRLDSNKGIEVVADYGVMRYGQSFDVFTKTAQATQPYKGMVNMCPGLTIDPVTGNVGIGAAPAAQPDTWTDDGGWTFPIEGGSNV